MKNFKLVKNLKNVNTISDRFYLSQINKFIATTLFYKGLKLVDILQTWVSTK